MSNAGHRLNLPKDLRYYLIIASGSITSKKARGEAFNDVSGNVAAALLASEGYSVVEKIYLPNSADAIRDAVRSCASSGKADVLLVSGGTGISSRDVTVEAVKPLFEKELPGFGELFRHLSYESIGTSAIASRAMGGVVGGSLVFLLPGSPEAVRLALQRIILPESPHLLKMVRG